ncbi:class II glutamine amidotransferase [Rhodotorula paludigena]|uniref:class II glutamine amidotransferase n=1 Tax=Rhodotorula paludigena TaxID=86838 RepID=UPI003171075A
MCRWIAYFSTEPILLADVILRSEHSLVSQTHHHYLPDVPPPYNVADNLTNPNHKTNVDGFGVGWYTSVPARYGALLHDSIAHAHTQLLSPTVYRSVQDPEGNENLAEICQSIPSAVVFGHIRAATAGRNSQANCHPFKAGRFLFMHNGGIGGFATHVHEIRQRVSYAARRVIKGDTDSEHAFALFLSYLDSDGPWLRDYYTWELETALRRTIAELISICEPQGGWVDAHGHPRSWISFNVALSTGTDFLALRFAHPPEREAPSLYWSSVGGSALDRRYRQHPDGGRDLGNKPREEHAPHVVVASEPMTKEAHDEWVLMKNGDLLLSTTAELDLVQTQREHQLKTHTLPPKGWWKPRIKRLFPAREPDHLSPLHSSRVHDLRLYPTARSNR